MMFTIMFKMFKMLRLCLPVKADGDFHPLLVAAGSHRGRAHLAGQMETWKKMELVFVALMFTSVAFTEGGISLLHFLSYLHHWHQWHFFIHWCWAFQTNVNLKRRNQKSISKYEILSYRATAVKDFLPCSKFQQYPLPSCTFHQPH